MADLKRSDQLDAWIEATTPRLLAYAMSLVRHQDLAEDLVHDCFSRLLAKSDQYDLVRDGTKLMFKAVSNACMNWLGRHRRNESLEPYTGVPQKPENNPEQQAMHHELEQALQASLLKLPVNQRAVMALRSLGYSLIEVAEMLDMSHANARVQLHRARATLSQFLQPFLDRGA